MIEESDAIFITVPDGAITAVYQQVRQYQIQDKYICHCSGALSAAGAFPAIGETGAHGFSIHPLFPISSKYEAYRELSGAFFCLEGEAAYLPVFQSLLESLGCDLVFHPEVSEMYPEGFATYVEIQSDMPKQLCSKTRLIDNFIVEGK